MVSNVVISLLSIIGLLTVPIMRFSRFYGRFMALLIAMAVGTLIGDAILHLLPHVSGVVVIDEIHHRLSPASPFPISFSLVSFYSGRSAAFDVARRSSQGGGEPLISLRLAQSRPYGAVENGLR